VFLTPDRWRQIVRLKHPALLGRERQVRDCLASPVLVRESIKEPSMHLYFAPVGQVTLCVVVAPAHKREGFVVTAYYTRNIKQGRELWKK
jgi:hypothetical protein